MSNRKSGNYYYIISDVYPINSYNYSNLNNITNFSLTGALNYTIPTISNSTIDLSNLDKYITLVNYDSIDEKVMNMQNFPDADEALKKFVGK